MSGSSADPTPPARGGVDPSPETAEIRERLAKAERDLQLVESKLAETERSLYQLSSFFSNAGIPIVITDCAGRITEANVEAERRWGRSRVELVGAALSSIVPEGNHAALDELFASCLEGESATDIAGRLFNLPKSVRSAGLRLAPSFDAAGEIDGVVLAEDTRALKETGSFLESLNERLRDLALIDGLTKLANRRQFERQYRREFARAARERSVLSLIMIDVDDFKAYNDSLGHPAGDSCLRRVADAIAGCLLRPADLLARYGGEEFVAILPGTEHSGALRLGERIRSAVEMTRTEHPYSRTGPFVTVSVGVSSALITPDFDSATLREQADRALYAAKRAGRNRVHAIDLDRVQRIRPKDEVGDPTGDRSAEA